MNDTLQRTGTHPTDQLNGQDPGDLYHYVCECDEDRAFCGFDVTGVPWGNQDDDEMCQPCLEMAQLACLRCNW